jgi:epoxyqueuosine reductase
MIMKQKIREFALGLGVDDVGFAAAADCNSSLSPKIETLFPEAKSLVVMAVKEMSHTESPNHQIAMNGRLDIMEFMRGINYRVTRFLEMKCGARAMSIPLSYPMNFDPSTKGVIADLSLRHAAVAAGLGEFGRHNLVIHPRLGTRVLFVAVLSNLKMLSDPPVKENLCTYCNLCVENCPAGALNNEGQTDAMKCLKFSQPYGLGMNIKFWAQWAGKTPEEQQKMLFSKDFWMMYQANFIGFQYFCFKCYTSCPIGEN